MKMTTTVMRIWMMMMSALVMQLLRRSAGSEQQGWVQQWQPDLAGRQHRRQQRASRWGASQLSLSWVMRHDTNTICLLHLNIGG
jgi:hypothetical protein